MLTRRSWRKIDRIFFICSCFMSSRLSCLWNDLFVSCFERIFKQRFFMGIFIADYSFMAEHTDLRHIMGVGIAITRGSAASLSFCYSLLLLTMSRNLITKLKEFAIQQYIPLDSHIQFHKIVACTALFFSLLHTVGHIVNFYHVSTQSIENLRCLTREVHFTSDYKPDITFWIFQTVTGIYLFIFVNA